MKDKKKNDHNISPSPAPSHGAPWCPSGVLLSGSGRDVTTDESIVMLKEEEEEKKRDKKFDKFSYNPGVRDTEEQNLSSASFPPPDLPLNRIVSARSSQPLI